MFESEGGRGMIPISEIERVISELEHAKSLYQPSDFEDEYDDGKIMAYNNSIQLLKELIPSEE
jgi:hypothetical protein